MHIYATREWRYINAKIMQLVKYQLIMPDRYLSAQCRSWLGSAFSKLFATRYFERLSCDYEISLGTCSAAGMRAFAHWAIGWDVFR